MKNSILYFSTVAFATLIFGLWSLDCSAQYTKLLDFNGTNGRKPNGSLISDGTYLYGMTQNGGLRDSGEIFRIRPDGSGYADLHDFGSGTDGFLPLGSLISDGTYLYGMTSRGGIDDWGCIFKIKLNGTGYSKLLDFTGANAGYPNASLFYDGTFLYGMTSISNGVGKGGIFKIKTDGTGYSTMLNFNGANGANPNGSLISDGTFLYGMTLHGGAMGSGVIFKIKPDGSGYANLHNFGIGTDGFFPYGSLIYDGTYLYGMTSDGSVSYGNIFKIKPDGSGYTDLFDFVGADGFNAYGSLIYDGTFLYGMTSDFGYGYGSIFEIKTDGSEFLRMFNFNNGNGANPYGDLISDGTFLYGMTSGGGIGGGVIFKYYPIRASATMIGNPICSNQCNGSATATVFQGQLPYKYLWNTTPAQTSAIATGLCAGNVYTVTVTDKVGGTASSSIGILSLPKPPTPSICSVTVDSLSKYNDIIWDKTPYKGTSIDSFIVYREITSNNYKPIGAVSIHALSMFVDTVRAKYFPFTGNPNSGTYRYKLAMRDTCGNYSQMSHYHNTIFVTNNSGTFSWNLYTIDSTANPVTGYVLLRDDNSIGNWHSVAAVSGSQQTVTDPDYTTHQSTASWRVQTQWNITCTPTLRVSSASFNSSLSNIYSAKHIGINEVSLNDLVNIYPNPTTSNFTISFPPTTKQIQITNSIGQLVGAKDFSPLHESPLHGQTKMDFSLPDNGIYFIRILTDKEAITKKVTVCR